MMFNSDNQDHVALLKALFREDDPFPTIYDGLEPKAPSDSEIKFLEDIQTSRNVKLESVTHRKLSDVASALGPQKRKELVAWLVAQKYRVFLWDGHLVILNNDVSEIKVVRGPIIKI